MVEPIISVVRDSVAYIVFNRPEKRNAFDSSMWRLFGDLLARYCFGSGVRAVVLRGAGGVFSAGDDIEEMYRLSSVEESRRFFRVVGRAVRFLIECPRPVVSVVEGPAMGAGAELLLASDIVIASRNSVIGFPEARLGLLPPLLSTLGVFVLGVRRAKALALSGATLAPEEARRIGLVDVVVEPEIIDDALKETLAMVLASPSHASSTIKESIVASIRPAYEAALSKLELMVLSREAKERMRMFLEGRSNG